MPATAQTGQFDGKKIKKDTVQMWKVLKYKKTDKKSIQLLEQDWFGTQTY